MLRGAISRAATPLKRVAEMAVLKRVQAVGRLAYREGSATTNGAGTFISVGRI